MIPYATLTNVGRAQPLNWMNYPSAWYYNNRTYLSFGGAVSGANDYDLYVTYYDHKRRRWVTPVKVADATYKDDHGCPAIMVDNNGYIHVFHCSGNISTAFKHYKSNSSEKIKGWTAQADIEAAGGDTAWSYPKLVRSDDTVWLFYSYSTSSGGVKVRRVYFKKSTDNGLNWSAKQLIIENGTDEGYEYGVYQGHAERFGNTIHTAWCYVTDKTADYPTRHVYHAYLNTTDNHMYNMNNTDLGTSISLAEANANCKIVDSGTLGVGQHALHLDSNGYPWIMYLEGQGITTQSWNYYHIRWNGTAWTTPEKITATGNSAGGTILQGKNLQDFIIDSVTSVTAFVPVGPGGQRGGDIEEWKWNGSHWGKIRTILSESESGVVLNCPMVPSSFHSSLKLVFCQFLINNFTTPLKVYETPTIDVNTEIINVMNVFSKKVRGHPNFEVTRFMLQLGTRDTTTGWYAKNYIETPIEMFVAQKEQQSTALSLGYWISLDALGFTINPVAVYDLIKDKFGRFWEIKAVKPFIIGDVTKYFACDLKELPLNG